MTRTPARVAFEKPLKRESVADLVARRVLDMVTSGVLKAGEQLPPERELAATLGVSRPSVREAIRGLSILGVVRTRQGGGAYISELDADALLGPIQFFLSLEDVNIRELYDARSLIESDVARRAAENISQECLDEIAEILDRQKDLLDDPIAFRKSDFEFHKVIWRGSNNAFLKRIGESLNVMGLEFRRRAAESSDILAQSFHDHLVLFEALKARDVDAAAKAAELHMQNVYKSTIVQSEV